MLATKASSVQAATALVDCALMVLDTERMRHLLRTDYEIASYFTTFVLRRTAETQADLIDQLFNSTSASREFSSCFRMLSLMVRRS